MITTIRAKIVWTFVGLVVLNLASSFWSIFNFYKLGTTVATILRGNYQSVLAAENMVKSLERQDNALLVASEGELPAAAGGFTENKELFYSWYEQAVQSVAAPSQQPLRDSIQNAYRHYVMVADSMLLRIQQQGEKAVDYYYRMVRPSSDRLRGLCFRLFEVNQAAMYNAESQTHSIANQTAFGSMITSMIILVLSMIATGWLIKSVITPAEQLTETVRQIGAGKLDLKIDVLSNDEVGQLSREFNKMTERLRQYEQLNIEQILSEKRKSETIVASISDGLIATDAELQVLHLNQVTADLFGVDEHAAVGAPVDTVIRDERLLALIRTVTGGTAGEADRRPADLQFVRGEKYLYYRPRLSRIVDAEGGFYGVLMLLHDVTQSKELDRMKSDFIATLSHEFRTPVTSINMSVDILNRGILGPLNERQKELIDAAREDCTRLTKLARELLQLSKLESGRLRLRNEELDVRAVVDASLRSLHLPFAEKRVKLSVEVAAGLPSLLADEQQLGWVITNLVTNALKYTDAGGSVHVRARREGDAVLLQVEDTGQGIAREHQEEIFDKFVQVKHSSDSTPGSVGLGLAIAREIVEMYGGRIWVESEVGRGSTFSVLLPLRPAGRAVQA